MTIVSAAGDRHHEFMSKTGNAGDMDKNAFLQLLITQLRYQDPLEPRDNGEFLAQMAQFTSLEQVQNMNTSMEELLAAQDQFQERLLSQVKEFNTGMENLIHLTRMAQLNSFDRELKLLDKEVVVRRSDGEEVAGRVTGVTFSGGSAKLVVGDETFGMDQVVRIRSGEEHEG